MKSRMLIIRRDHQAIQEDRGVHQEWGTLIVEFGGQCAHVDGTELTRTLLAIKSVQLVQANRCTTEGVSHWEVIFEWLNSQSPNLSHEIRDAVEHFFDEHRYAGDGWFPERWDGCGARI